MNTHKHVRTVPLRLAAFMSGTGSNLRRIIELQKQLNDELFQVMLIFSDTKDEKCNADKIGREYGIPVIIRDINDYYSERGHANKKDMKLREEYDLETSRELEKMDISMVALCGYMSLVTAQIYSNFITLNVHPADLANNDAHGRRIYAGCIGAGCIKKAILNGDKEIRSTVHLVNEELDGGPIIGLSAPVKIDDDYSGLPEDELNAVAASYQDELKQKGDWVMYPQVIRMIAEERIKLDNDGNVFVDGVLMRHGHRF